MIVVTDEVIADAVAPSFKEALRREGLTLTELLVLKGKPPLVADYQRIQEIITQVQGLLTTPMRDGKKGERALCQSLLVSLGSGTINDLVKCSAGTLGVPYLSVPTAPSVDGYSSFGASILKENFKQTLPCPAPRAVFTAPEVLSAAPVQLRAAGYGDLASKITAGSDWVLADAFGLDPIDETAWAYTQEGLIKRLSAAPDDLANEIFVGLVRTGFAMQITSSSRPVSGAEHLISHVWEMEHLEIDGITVPHGIKVGIGLLTISAFTFLVLDHMRNGINLDALPKIPGPEVRAQEVAQRCAHLPVSAYRAIEEVALSKLPTQETVNERYNYEKKWYRNLADKIETQLVPLEELKGMLARAGCLTSPRELGVDRSRFLRTLEIAQMIRSRYTVLDFAWETGLFESCAEEITDMFF